MRLSVFLEGYLSPSLNTMLGAHWGDLLRLKREANHYFSQALYRLPPLPKIQSGTRCNVTFERRASKLLDSDNLAGGLKYMLDSIRRAGVICDDCPGLVEVTYSQRVVKKKEAGLLIQVSVCEKI